MRESVYFQFSFLLRQTRISINFSGRACAYKRKIMHVYYLFYNFLYYSRGSTIARTRTSQWYNTRQQQKFLLNLFCTVEYYLCSNFRLIPNRLLVCCPSEVRGKVDFILFASAASSSASSANSRLRFVRQGTDAAHTQSQLYIAVEWKTRTIRKILSPT